MALGAYDWACLAVLLLSLLLGAWRGLVYELVSLLGWVLALVLARLSYGLLAALVPPTWASESVREVLAFVFVFVLAAFVGGLLATLLRRGVSAVGLRPVDRTLGAVFGFARGLLLLLALAWVVHASPLRDAAWWQQALSAKLALAWLAELQPWLPETLRIYLPNFPEPS